MQCISGILHRMFDRYAALSVCLGCWIKGLTGMIDRVIHRDAGCGCFKRDVSKVSWNQCSTRITDWVFDRDAV